MVRRMAGKVAMATALVVAMEAPAYGQFADLKPITELNSKYGESHILVSSDNLRCYFSTDRLDPVPMNMDIFYAERVSLSDPFTIVGPVSNINTGKSDKASFLTNDELILYLATANADAYPNWDLYTSSRPDTTASFGKPVRITELYTTDNEINAIVSTDGLELLFEFFPGGPFGGDNKIKRSIRATTASPWGSPQQVTELDVSKYQIKPVFYQDDKQLVFGCDLRSPNDMDICYTKRATTSDPWEMPVVLAAVSTLGYNDTPSAFVGAAPDRFLYFYSNRLSGNLDDLWSVRIVCSAQTLPPDVGVMRLVKDTVNPGTIKVATAPQLDCVNGFNVYENNFGVYNGTNMFVCHTTATPAIEYVTFNITPTKPSQYFVVTGSNSVGEGPSGTIPTPQNCGPF